MLSNFTYVYIVCLQLHSIIKINNVDDVSKMK